MAAKKAPVQPDLENSPDEVVRFQYLNGFVGFVNRSAAEVMEHELQGEIVAEVTE